VSETQQPIDSWGMAWVHQVYRREFHLLISLVRGVADGDKDRAALVAEHIADIATSLHEHHLAEDEVLWPLLLQRATPEAEVVHRMEKQHDALHVLLQQLAELTPRWREHPSTALRDELGDLVARTSAVIDEHLDDEEVHVMPLINKHITQDEWMTFERRGHESIPQEKALLFLGLGLQDATPHERTQFLGGLPPEVLQMWEQVGKAAYDAQRANLLGAA
jgi:hemerythrin-like domain-containing protein